MIFCLYSLTLSVISWKSSRQLAVLLRTHGNTSERIYWENIFPVPRILEQRCSFSAARDHFNSRFGISIWRAHSSHLHPTCQGHTGCHCSKPASCHHAVRTALSRSSPPRVTCFPDTLARAPLASVYWVLATGGALNVNKRDVAPALLSFSSWERDLLSHYLYI